MTDTKIGILFDVDGVIADSETVNVRATAKAFEAIIGISDVRAEDFEAGIGRGSEEYVKAGARTHGQELSPDEVQSLVKARQDNFLEILRHEPLPAYPGVLELIHSALTHEIFAVAIATSGTREKSQAVLESAKIPYQDMVYICGDDITRKKPDPEVFAVVCRRLNLSPNRCVALEDAPNGVEAAHAAGCKCIAITNTCTRGMLKAADLIVDSLSSVSLNTILGLISPS